MIVILSYENIIWSSNFTMETQSRQELYFFLLSLKEAEQIEAVSIVACRLNDPSSEIEIEVRTVANRPQHPG